MTWWTDKGHVALFGPTRQGKSTKANEHHTTNTGFKSVFLDPETDSHDQAEINGPRVNTPREAAKVLDGGSRIVVLSPERDTAKAYYDLAYKTQKWLFRVGEASNVDIQVFMDEVPDIAPQGQSGTPAHKIARRGAKRGIKGWFLGQDPAEVDKGFLRNCDYIVAVGSIGQFSIDYWEAKNMYYEIASQEQYQYTVFSRSGVVDRGVTNPRYG